MPLKEGSSVDNVADTVEQSAGSSARKLSRKRFLNLGLGVLAAALTSALHNRPASASPLSPDHNKVDIFGPQEPFDLEYLLSLKTGNVVAGFDPEVDPTRRYIASELISPNSPVVTQDKAQLTSLNAGDYLFIEIAPEKLSSTGGLSLVDASGSQQEIKVSLDKIIIGNDSDTPMNYIVGDRGIPVIFGLTIGRDGYLKLINQSGRPRIIERISGLEDSSGKKVYPLGIGLYANEDSQVSLNKAIKLTPRV